MIDIKVVKYSNPLSRDQGIESMAREGWKVNHVQVVSGSYGCFEVTCLFFIFWPLMLLGKKNETYSVTYHKKTD